MRLVGWVEFARGRVKVEKKSKYSVSTKALGMKIQDIYQNTVGEDRVMIILYFTDSRKCFFIFF